MNSIFAARIGGVLTIACLDEGDIEFARMALAEHPNEFGRAVKLLREVAPELTLKQATVAIKVAFGEDEPVAVGVDWASKGEP